MADERSYTAVEHAAILETEVARATTDLRVARDGLETEKSGLQKSVTELEAEKADLLTRIDKLDAEKVTSESAKVAAEKELADYKAEIDRKAEVAALRTERSEKAKAELVGIGAEYFTDERTARWAEMSAEGFDSVLADLKETAGAMKPKGEEEKTETEKAARETAAFKGGTTPTSTGQSTFMQLIAARRSA